MRLDSDHKLVNTRTLRTVKGIWILTSPFCLVPPGLTTPESVDVDWVARRLYIIDSGIPKVIVCALDGTVCSILIESDIEKPRSVVVDPHAG